MEILYADGEIVVCVKPAKVLSTDEPGGLPELLRQTLGTQDFRTVHRLDRVVSGLMVVARNAAAASDLSRQIREDTFEKEYQNIKEKINNMNNDIEDTPVANDTITEDISE